jgi:signal recognition particle subunit SRP54
MNQVRNMGPIDQILGMIPGFNGAKKLNDLEINDKQLDHIEALINSMTAEEKRNPEIINGSRRKRIARGSGTTIQEVNRLLKQFKETKKLMKQMNGMQRGFGKKKFPFLG